MYPRVNVRSCISPVSAWKNKQPELRVCVCVWDQEQGPLFHAPTSESIQNKNATTDAEMDAATLLSTYVSKTDKCI